MKSKMHDMLVATIIDEPGGIDLTQSEFESIVDAITHQGAFVENVEWLSENEAVDIYVKGIERDELMGVLANYTARLPFDFYVQGTENRRKKLFLSDMDSTIIACECVDELADFVGKKEEVAKITNLAMAGKLDFNSALRERVALLKGLHESTLQKCYDERVVLNPGAKTLVKTLAANDVTCVLVSGGFTFFTERVALECGFHYNHANLLDREKGVLNGRVVEPILGGEAKRATLFGYMREHDIPHALTMSSGDGANDIPMLTECSLGVAYRARPAVRQAVDCHINHCELTAMLYMQGYKKSEWVTE